MPKILSIAFPGCPSGGREDRLRRGHHQDTFMTRTRRRLAAAITILALCSSCFTTHLWEMGHDGPGEERDGGETALKIFLTPFTLLLDLCTAPFQAEWLEDDC